MKRISKYIVKFLKRKGGKNVQSQFPGSAAYWENRYQQGGNSGAGSYNRLAEFKAEVLNNFCRQNDVQKVIEFGCGDGNQLKLAKYRQYIGLDVSIKSVEICKKKFIDDNTKKFYTLENLNLKEERFKSDLVLSLDVIYHLIEDDVYETYMRNIFSVSSKYVIIYASNYEFQPEAIHVRHRCFTDYIKKQYPEFRLINIVKNKYPFDDNDPKNTSFADFYFFEKSNTSVKK